jgi:hypothetical protein
LLVAVYFLPSFLVVAIGKGQLQNRHPKARQRQVCISAMKTLWKANKEVYDRSFTMEIFCQPFSLHLFRI